MSVIDPTTIVEKIKKIHQDCDFKISSKFVSKVMKNYKYILIVYYRNKRQNLSQTDLISRVYKERRSL
ncbi:unnamed protein product [Paramecium sonneborni]|uniref:Uncharacterized protein n=1 Tax=Paramecium sonneborni TaxID=65129 RepID=A0A8S1L5K7_9CILI|nr:unnamed protein product [Paramecium sonneborni]